MDTSSFQRLPDSIQKLITDGLDREVRSGQELLNQAKKSGSLTSERRATIKSDMRKATELRDRFSRG